MNPLCSQVVWQWILFVSFTRWQEIPLRSRAWTRTGSLWWWFQGSWFCPPAPLRLHRCRWSVMRCHSFWNQQSAPRFCWCWQQVNELHGWDCIDCWAEIQKWHYYIIAILILHVCEHWVEGSRYDNLCGSVGSESLLVRVQAGRDVISDELENCLSTSSGWRWEPQSFRLDTADFLATGMMMFDFFLTLFPCSEISAINLLNTLSLLLRLCLFLKRELQYYPLEKCSLCWHFQVNVNWFPLCACMGFVSLPHVDTPRVALYLDIWQC